MFSCLNVSLQITENCLYVNTKKTEKSQLKQQVRQLDSLSKLRRDIDKKLCLMLKNWWDIKVSCLVRHSALSAMQCVYSHVFLYLCWLWTAKHSVQTYTRCGKHLRQLLWIAKIWFIYVFNVVLDTHQWCVSAEVSMHRFVWFFWFLTFNLRLLFMLP